MSWQGIEGHDEIVSQFRQRLARGRLASTFLFVGPDGIGKRTFALKLAQSLLCQIIDSNELNPCGRCENCIQVLAGTHPDILQVAKPADKSEIPVALFIGAKERRMQEGLCHDLWLKPKMGGRRIAIIDDADSLNEEGANCLLKTLEEPPPGAVMILVGTSLERQLPTIRSRSQIIRFRPLSTDVVASLLVSRGLISDPGEAARLAAHSDGSLSAALELADPALWQFRADLLDRLATSGWEPIVVAKQVLTFVDEAGKEATARRARARILIGFVIAFYRGIARTLLGVAESTDPELSNVSHRAVAQWTGNVDTATACIERSLEGLDHLQRYANQTTLIEGWLDELSALVTARPVAASRKG